MEKYKTVHENAVMINPPKELDLSVRALNSIKQANIKTTEELFNLSTNDMINLKFGRKTILEINELKKILVPIEEDIVENLKLAVLNLDRYDNYSGEDNACFIREVSDGEYVKLEDVLNLFSAKK